MVDQVPMDTSCRICPGSEPGAVVQVRATSPGSIEVGGQRYTVDHALGPTSSQEAVYAEIGHPAAESLWNGYHVCILGMGDTGSGKTHTLVGSAVSPGLFPKIASTIFDRISYSSQWQVGISYWDLVDGRVVDLLNPDVPEGVTVGYTTSSPVTVTIVRNMAEFSDVLTSGKLASRNWDGSSTARPNNAHAFLRLVLYNTVHRTGSILHMVDLASSRSPSIQNDLEAVDRLLRSNLSSSRLDTPLSAYLRRLLANHRVFIQANVVENSASVQGVCELLEVVSACRQNSVPCATNEFVDWDTLCGHLHTYHGTYWMNNRYSSSQDIPPRPRTHSYTRPAYVPRTYVPPVTTTTTTTTAMPAASKNPSDMTREELISFFNRHRVDNTEPIPSSRPIPSYPQDYLTDEVNGLKARLADKEAQLNDLDRKVAKDEWDDYRLHKVTTSDSVDDIVRNSSRRRRIIEELQPGRYNPRLLEDLLRDRKPTDQLETDSLDGYPYLRSKYARNLDTYVDLMRVQTGQDGRVKAQVDALLDQCERQQKEITDLQSRLFRAEEERDIALAKNEAMRDDLDAAEADARTKANLGKKLLSEVEKQRLKKKSKTTELEKLMLQLDEAEDGKICLERKLRECKDVIRIQKQTTKSQENEVKDLKAEIAKLKLTKKDFHRQQHRLVEIITDIHAVLEAATSHAKKCSERGYFSASSRRITEKIRLVFDSLIDVATQFDLHKTHLQTLKSLKRRTA